MWIRNTNKWPQRNMPAETYSSVFNYCITNQKTVHVFQDLDKISIPDSEYIIECDYRINNIPVFDKFKEICDKSSLFIGVDSGAIYVAQTSCNIVTVCIGSDGHGYQRNSIYCHANDIYNFLTNFYNNV